MFKVSPLLSICIPSLPARIDKFIKLYEKIERQSLDYKDKVEIISIMDNKSMSVGKKRKSLFSLSSGLYTCQIDDDDDVSDDFISTLIPIIEDITTSDRNPGVISYNQKCNIDGKELLVVSSIEYPTTDSHIKNNIMYRYPWHWCCWRNDIAKSGSFLNCNGIEDSIFSKSLKYKVVSEIKLDKVLCYYNFQKSLTQSPQISISLEEEQNLEIL